MTYQQTLCFVAAMMFGLFVGNRLAMMWAVWP